MPFAWCLFAATFIMCHTVALSLWCFQWIGEILSDIYVYTRESTAPKCWMQIESSYICLHTGMAAPSPCCVTIHTQEPTTVVFTSSSTKKCQCQVCHLIMFSVKLLMHFRFSKADILWNLWSDVVWGCGRKNYSQSIWFDIEHFHELTSPFYIHRFNSISSKLHYTIQTLLHHFRSSTSSCNLLALLWSNIYIF